MTPERPNPEVQHLEALRQRQRREAARGCLLAMVLEGAALLSVALWGVAIALDLPRLASAGVGAFVLFTLAAALVGLLLLVQGNLPRHRRLRREHEEAIGRYAAGEHRTDDPG